mmetsp:Transcript_24189/g.64397  ORF Transcript_24189/g.64397 Transcript_24189/m.64397 type:complete len:251 (+) Transcript_24189:607-1359(+)
MKIRVLSQELVVVPAFDKLPIFTESALTSVDMKSPIWTTPPLLYTADSSHSKMLALFQYCCVASPGSYPTVLTTMKQKSVASFVVVVVRVVVVTEVVVELVLVRVVVAVDVLVVVVPVMVVEVEEIRCRFKAAWPKTVCSEPAASVTKCHVLCGAGAGAESRSADEDGRSSGPTEEARRWWEEAEPFSWFCSDCCWTLLVPLLLSDVKPEPAAAAFLTRTVAATAAKRPRRTQTSLVLCRVLGSDSPSCE